MLHRALAHCSYPVTQGARIAVSAVALCFIDPAIVTDALIRMPKWLIGGMAVGGGMVAAVGYAMVINMMATVRIWPFLLLALFFAAINQLTLIALGVIGVCLGIFSTLVLKTLLSRVVRRWQDLVIRSAIIIDNH